MKPEELRIGNLVQAKSPEKDKYESPIILDKDYFIMALNKKIDIQPIELAEEWLIKFGFYKRSNGYFIEVNKSWSIRVFIHDNIVNFALSNWTTLELKYVHLLQNLYFVLTEKKLELK